MTRFYEWVGVMAGHERAMKMHFAEFPGEFHLAGENEFEQDRSQLLNGLMLSLAWVDTVFPPFADDFPWLDDPDPADFSLYTCICFQWNLFETFVRTSIFALLADELIPAEHVDELSSIRNQTEKLLLFIKKGKALGVNPFDGWMRIPHPRGEFVPVSYSDLDSIRELRNLFVHAIDSPEMIAAGREDRHDEYVRITNTLLLFAHEIDLRIAHIRKVAKGSSGKGVDLLQE